MKIKLVVNLGKRRSINTVLDIIERKIKQEENRYRSFGRGKQLMSWTIFLLLQPKRKLQTTFREF
jgi:hypothetical protein